MTSRRENFAWCDAKFAVIALLLAWHFWIEGVPDEQARICRRRPGVFQHRRFANSKPADDEAGKIKQTLTDWGCTGGTFEKETEASSFFEADDVKCKDGNQYDVKLDGSFKVLSITRD